MFGVEAEIQNVVGTNNWGIYFDLFNLGFIFQILHEPGIQSYNSRNVARDPSSLSRYLPRILGLKVFLLFVFIAVTSGAFYVLGYEKELYTLLLWICFNQFLSTLYMYLRSNISAIGRYRTDSFLSALDKVIMLVILGALVYLPQTRQSFNILWLVYGQAVAYAVAILFALYVLYKHLGGLQICFSINFSKEYIKKSVPYALILLFMTIYTRIDGVMLGRLIGDNNYQAGIYGACYRILDALNMIGYLMAALLLPMFSSLKQIKKELLELFEAGLKLVLALCLTIGTLFIVYRTEILSTLYDEYNSIYEQVLFPLVLGYIMISISYIYGTFLVSRKDVAKLNYLYGSGIIINIGLNIFLIPSYYAVGAAWATMLTETAMLIGQFFLVRKYRVDNLSFRELVRIVLFVISIVGVSYGMYLYIPGYWLIKLISTGLVAVGFTFLYGMIRVKDILIFKKE